MGQNVEMLMDVLKEERAKMKQYQNKQCSKCGEIKVVSDFYKNRSKEDGLSTWCKVCVNASNKKKSSGAAVKGKAQANKKPAAARIQSDAPAKSSKSSNLLVLNFTGHEELLEQIMATAAMEMRDPKQQVMYCCDQFLKFSKPWESPVIVNHSAQTETVRVDGF